MVQRKLTEYIRIFRLLSKNDVRPFVNKVVVLRFVHSPHGLRVFIIVAKFKDASMLAAFNNRNYFKRCLLGSKTWNWLKPIVLHCAAGNHRAFEYEIRFGSKLLQCMRRSD